MVTKWVPWMDLNGRYFFSNLLLNTTLDGLIRRSGMHRNGAIVIFTFVFIVPNIKKSVKIHLTATVPFSINVFRFSTDNAKQILILKLVLHVQPLKRDKVSSGFTHSQITQHAELCSTSSSCLSNHVRSDGGNV